MNKFKTALLALLLSSVLSDAQHWAPLPFRFDDNSVWCLPDSESDSMYMLGFFQKVNGATANLVQWNGNTGITYSSLFGNGNLDDVTTFHGKTYVNGGGAIFRKDDTGWYRTNNPLFRQGGGLLRWDYRLVTMMQYYDSTGWVSSHWNVWDGAVWKDTLRYDTLWPGELWGAGCWAWYKGELYVGGNIAPHNHPEY